MFILKLVAAVIGLFSLGPFGAILGWFAGSLIGNLITDGPRALLPGGRREIREERQAVFLKTLFLLMGRLAKADSRVSQSEIDHVEQFMAQAGMTAEHRKEAISHFQEGVKSEFHMDGTLNHFLAVCGRSLQMKHLLLVYMAGIAMADGDIHSAEKEILGRVASRLGYSEQAFNQLMAMIQGQNRFAGGAGYQHQHGPGAGPRGATNTLEDAYQALGVSASDNDKDIKRAYRKLISQYHPDKLSHLGEEFSNLANEKFLEIQQAYTKLKSIYNR